MKYATLGLLAVLLVVGCNDQGSKPKPEPKSHGHDHHEPGPNGGTVFDLGKYHVEFTVDHDKKECALLFLGEDDKTPLAIAAKDLLLTTKPAKGEDGSTVPAMTIKLQPQGETDGKASKYVGTDPGLAHKVDFEGTVTGVIDDKPAKGNFKEEDHDHDHDDKK